MERFRIPMEIYGPSRSLSTKRAQRDMNAMTHPIEGAKVEPGQFTVIMKLPYRKQDLLIHVQMGRYYPFKPPTMIVEHEYTYYRYYLSKISPVEDLIPDILAYTGHKKRMSLKRFLYEDNGKSPETLSQCDKMLNPWSPCFTLQIVADNVIELFGTIN